MADVAELGWRSNTDPLKRSADQLRRVRDEGRGAASANDEYNNSTTRAATGTERLNGKMERLGGFLGSLKSQIIGFGATMVVAFGFQQAIGSALEFSQKIGELSTIAGEGLGDMTQAAKSFAAEFGGSAATQAAAFYQAVSAGGNAAATSADAINLLDVANRVAIGGAAQLTPVVDIMASALNAYASAGLTAADAADILFVGAAAGQTSIEELASGLGRVIPAATALDVSFEQLVAAVSSLTAVGQSTDTAITGVGQALSQVLSPSHDASELAKSLGLQFDAAALKAKGFSQFMRDVTEATGGSEDEMATLFGSVQAMRAVFALTGNAAGIFADTLDNMADRAGAADRAFDLMSQTLSQRFKVVMAQIGAVALDFGTFLLNTLTPALELVANNIGLVSAALAIMAVRFAAPALLAVGTWIAGLVAGFLRTQAMIIALNGGLTVTTARFYAANAAASLFTRTLAFVGGPIGVALLAIAGTIALFSGNARAANTELEIQQRYVEAVGNAYVTAQGNAAGLTEELRTQNQLTLGQALNSRDNLRADFDRRMSEIQNMFGLINQFSFMIANSNQQLVDWGESLKNSIDGIAIQAITLDDFIARVDEVAVATTGVTGENAAWAGSINHVALQLITMANNLKTSGVAVDNADIVVRALTGSLTEEDLAAIAAGNSARGLGAAGDTAAGGLNNAGGAADAIIPNLDAAAAAANRASAALRTLNSIAAAPVTDRVAARNAYFDAVDNYGAQVAAGGMTAEQAQTQTEAAYQQFQNTLTRIATEEANSRATQVAEIENEAYLGGLDGKSRALAEENQRYIEQMASLIQLGASADEFNRATAAHSALLDNINHQYEEIGHTVGGSGGVADQIDKATKAAEDMAEVLKQIGDDMRKTVVDAFKGFFQDLYRGNSLLEAFANSLDKIVGKMFDLWLNNIFAGFLAKPMGGGGPILTFIRSLIGLSDGGYTGDGGRNTVAGFVHGQEYVVNAGATQKYRPILEAMNDNRPVRDWASMGNVAPIRPMAAPAGMRGAGIPNIIIVNKTDTAATAKAEFNNNGDLIITLDKMNEQLINKPGSRTAKALQNVGRMGAR